MRLVKCTSHSNRILLDVIVDDAPSSREDELVSEAASEIIADFPGFKICESIQISNSIIQTEDYFSAGWIYRRYEG